MKITHNDVPLSVLALIDLACGLDVIDVMDAYMLGVEHGTDWSGFSRAILVASEEDEGLEKRGLEQIRQMTVQVWNEIG